ncbi:hypothetical protein VPARA_60770 [Variovorax paradoxus]|uniref:Uncharacterized protein n=1 Tax=Variovorax paradoxus TaxID=34073 RepID=A0A0H2M6V8_VARPD|nr:hypothetical protein VPARA_60770 [Variovorax paradoxus]
MSSIFLEKPWFIDRHSSELPAIHAHRFAEEGAAEVSTQKNEAALKVAQHSFAGRPV